MKECVLLKISHLVFYLRLFCQISFYVKIKHVLQLNPDLPIAFGRHLVIVLEHALIVVRDEIMNSYSRTLAGLVVLATLPVLLVAPQSVPVIPHLVDDQDLGGLVL